MNGEGCWSTVVCTPQERTALGLTGRSEWLLHCRLAAGHRGNHATDASSHPRVDRRLWLEWNDFDDHAQSLIERNPCTARSPQGTGCLFYEGHGGGHFFAPSNGHAPTAVSTPHAGPPAGPAPQRPAPPSPASAPPAPPRMAGPQQPAPPSAARQPAPRPATGPVPQRALDDAEAQRLRPGRPSPEPSGPMRSAAPRPPTPIPADPTSRRETTAQPVRAHAGHQGYRLGRRSTDAEPPADMTRQASSRHRLPDPDDEAPASAPVAPAPPARPPQASMPNQTLGTSGTGSAHEADGHGAEIAAALRDVAAALEKLAGAMRPTEGPTVRK